MQAIQSLGSQRKSISRIVTIAGVIVAVAAVALVALAWLSEQKLKAMDRTTETMTSALRNHVEGDMMHDALRSTVLASLEAGTANDSAAAADARRDLDEYGAWLKRLHEKNAQLDLPEETRSKLTRIEQDFDKYLATVAAIVPVALTDPQAARRQMPAFNRQFKQMESANEQFSDQLQKEAQQAKVVATASLGRVRILFAITTLSVIGIALGVIVFLRRRIVSPILRITRSLDSESETDLGAELSRSDEIGQLAHGVIGFRDATLAVQEAELARIRAEDEARREIAEQEAALLSQTTAEAERKRALVATAEELESRVMRIAEQVSETTLRLKQVADALSGSASRSREETASAAAAAQQTLDGVVTIAEAADELVISINEVSTRINHVAKSGEEVRVMAKSAEHTMSELSTMTDRIGNVTDLIGSIASRTSLLALNATIEAAQAGAAGRGFAVVAEEVKQLARQTAAAVHEIDEQVKAIASATRNAEGSIASVAGAIDTLGSATHSIAAAADQQGMATGEISRTIHQSSAGAESMRVNLTQMDHQAGETARNAEVVLDAARELEQRANELGREIADLITQAKAA